MLQFVFDFCLIVCIFLLQSYEWALEAMKYVAGMKMENCATPEGLEKLSVSLVLYLKEHPPISKETFDAMDQLAIKVRNEKLQEQCRVARSRCEETEQLLHVRHATLRKAKEQLVAEFQRQEKRRSIERRSPKPAMIPEEVEVHNVRLRHAHDAQDSQSWEPQEASTPRDVLAHFRRRSYAGKPSSPMYGVPFFKEYMNISEQDEKLFYDGLITEDLSDRVVASIPKSLADSRLRSSQDDLRGSNEDLLKDQKSSQSDTASMLAPPSGVTLNKHNRPHKKMMKKSLSSSGFEPKGLDAVQRELWERDHRQSKGISMITGSTESLPR